MKLYHRDIGFPPGLMTRLSGQSHVLHYGPHARQACLNDKYGAIMRPPKTVTFGDNVFEAETDESGVPVKVTVREHYDAVYDIILVVGGVSGPNLVRTCWLNKKADPHLTLDKTKYCAILK